MSPRLPLLALVVSCSPAPAPEHPSVTAQLVRLADTNGDGQVSAAEFEAGRLPGDDSPTADTNGDGVVSPVELEQWFLQTNPTKAQQRAQRANGQGLAPRNPARGPATGPRGPTPGEAPGGPPHRGAP
jgi:hypothetical protein